MLTIRDDLRTTRKRRVRVSTRSHQPAHLWSPSVWVLNNTGGYGGDLPQSATDRMLQLGSAAVPGYPLDIRLTCETNNDNDIVEQCTFSNFRFYTETPGWRFALPMNPEGRHRTMRDARARMTVVGSGMKQKIACGYASRYLNITVRLVSKLRLLRPQDVNISLSHDNPFPRKSNDFYANVMSPGA